MTIHKPPPPTYTKTDTNPAGIRIYFDEASHRYWTDRRTEFVSGTTFIKHYFPPFDGSAIAAKKAEKDCPDEQARADYAAALLRQWEAKRDAAADLGTRVHANCEMQIQGHPLPHMPRNDHERSIMATAFDAVYHIRDVLKFKLFAVEKIVFSESLSVAGTIDLLMYDAAGTVYVLDWKTNETIDSCNQWNRFALPPIDHVDDLNSTKYALQLSLYEWLLRDQGYIKLGTKVERAIIHLRPDAFQIIPMPSLDKDIRALVEDFRTNPWHLEF